MEKTHSKEIHKQQSQEEIKRMVGNKIIFSQIHDK